MELNVPIWWQSESLLKHWHQSRRPCSLVSRKALKFRQKHFHCREKKEEKSYIHLCPSFQTRDNQEMFLDQTISFQYLSKIGQMIEDLHESPFVPFNQRKRWRWRFLSELYSIVDDVRDRTIFSRFFLKIDRSNVHWFEPERVQKWTKEIIDSTIFKRTNFSFSSWKILKNLNCNEQKRNLSFQLEKSSQIDVLSLRSTLINEQMRKSEAETKRNDTKSVFRWKKRRRIINKEKSEMFWN